MYGKLLKKEITKKTADTNGDLIANKIAEKITNISTNSQENNSETVSNKHATEIPKESYISPEERQKIIDGLRLI